MNSVNEFLQRTSDQCGFVRSGFVEKNMPSSFSNITVIPCFYDLSSTMIAATFLFNQFKHLRPNRYLIICTWSGHKELYPYANEVWSPKDRSCLGLLQTQASHMNNMSDVFMQFCRALSSRIEDVLMPSDVLQYYDYGFQKKYWEEFKEIRKHLPEIPSISRSKFEINRLDGKKIVIHPVKTIHSWQRGRSIKIGVPRDFWVHLAKRLIKEGYIPVVYQNQVSFDLSTDLLEQCLYLTTEDIGDVLSCIKAAGCVLDIHSGFSNLSILARTPFIKVDERQRYVEEKDYVIDDLSCQDKIQRQYIFSFATFLLTGNEDDWNNSLVNNVIVRLKNFLPKLSDSSSTSRSEEVVSYDYVREQQKKRMGVKFIRTRGENSQVMKNFAEK